MAYIVFPETSLMKWLPEDVEQRVEGEKHLVVQLPDVMVSDPLDVLQTAYDEWKEIIPLTEAQPGLRKRGGGKGMGAEDDDSTDTPATLTSIMQRILAYPIESKSPLESMIFLADIKQRLAAMI